MDTADNYIEINRSLWNAKTEHHVSSDFYDMPSFLAGQTTLKNIELNLLGNIKEKEIVHLQCHFGQDSLSLARLGAKVTGLDFSDAAIEKAKELNAQLGLDATFVRADVYDAPKVLNKQFDMVFTTYGTIGWLPDMQRWANVVASLLKPDGKLVFVEFHPAVWMFDNEFTRIEYPYFNNGPIIETLEGTYADRSASIKQQEIGWNHSLSEVMQNLINAGMRIDVFEEYDYAPYDCFTGLMQLEPSKYQFKNMPGLMPMTYAIAATKV